MADRKTLRSLQDIGGNFKPAPPKFSMWDPGAMTVSVLGKVTAVLQDWLQARFADLCRERIPLDDISVVHQGGRTQVMVNGRVRFEFKLKCTMEGK